MCDQRKISIPCACPLIVLSELEIGETPVDRQTTMHRKNLLRQKEEETSMTVVDEMGIHHRTIRFAYRIQTLECWVSRAWRWSDGGVVMAV